MNCNEFVESKSSQLCLSCGLCCQGIFFFHDNAPDEFDLSPEPNNPLLPLACRIYREADNICLIYEDFNRPSLCQTWKCQTLRRLEQGEISLNQAQLKIKNIKLLLIKILRQISQKELLIPAYHFIQTVFDSLKRELDSGDCSNIELFMDINWLNLLIKRHIFPR